MNDIKAIISTFSNEDKQRFINYLEKKNRRNDTKNIQLFKLLLDVKLTSKEISHKLYKKDNRNAYHALRKRLHTSIIDFVAGINLEEESSEKMQIIKYILVARTLLEQQNYKTAFKLLEKAEILALEYQLYPYLNEIYHTKIQFSHTLAEIDLNELIVRFKSNQKLYFLEEELNIVYSKIRSILNQVTFEGKVVDFEVILEKTLNEHSIGVNESLSLKSIYQLLTIASISAFITKDYLRIESFILKVYNIIDIDEVNEIQLFYYIQILYMIANTFFRNKKFETSLHYLELMEAQMLNARKKYYGRFKLKYRLLLALNYNYTDRQQEAITYLEPLINIKHQDLESILDIHLSLIVFYFQKGDLDMASQTFSKFYHTDKWYIERAGKEWVIKKNLIEIILRLEKNNFDLFESRLLSFRRQYGAYLKEIKQERVLTFLKLIESYYRNPELVTTQEFYLVVKESFIWVGARREDIFVMSFYAWLKSKMEKQPIYTTTLGLIKKAQVI